MRSRTKNLGLLALCVGLTTATVVVPTPLALTSALPGLPGGAGVASAAPGDTTRFVALRPLAAGTIRMASMWYLASAPHLLLSR